MSERVAAGSLLGRASRIALVLGRQRLGDASARRGDEPAAERARRLRLALEELGPTFAKLGQLLSTRPDLIPPEFVEELARLQDDVAPLSEAEVVAVMEEELGVPWEDVFENIDPAPLAAGTIGQVHRATLEGGERVVVKVQRPSARKEILQDLALLEIFAEKLASRATFRQMADVPAVVAHLSASLVRELDFEQEAASIERLRASLSSFSHLGVPRVIAELSSARLLVLEEIQGVPLREAPSGEARKVAARQLLESYYRQILSDGFFHADPHPGNLLWADERIVFLDFGMVGEVAPEVRELLILLLLAFWQNDEAFLAEVVLMLAEEPPPDLDLAELQRELGALLRRFRHSSLREIELGPLLQAMMEIAVRHEVRLPASLALTAKALAQVQLAVAELDPELDPFALVGSFLMRLAVERARAGAEPARLFYEAQKVRVRVLRLVESFEEVIGSRPGRRLQVDFRTGALEETIRLAARRAALAAAAGSALIATGITAVSQHVADWVPITFGGTAGVLTLGLVADLLRRR